MKIEEVLRVVGDNPIVEYDLRNEDVVARLNALHALSWRLIVETLDDEPLWLQSPAKADFIHPREHTEAWVRSYEVAVLSCISWINGTRDRSRVENLIKTLQDELITGKAPGRSNLFLQGLAYYRLGNREMAQQRFSLGNAEYVLSGSVSPLFAYSRSVVCGAGKRNFPLGDYASSFAREQVDLPGFRDSVIFTSGNPPYISKYLPTYVDSLTKYNSTEYVDFHLHIMSDPGIDTQSSIDQVGEQLAYAENELGRSFSYSVSESPILKDMRSYFACKRFLMLDDFFDKYERVVVSDIDFEVVAPIDDFLRWLDSYDIAFRIAREDGTQSWAPWLRTMAGTVALRRTSNAREMIERFRELFNDLYFGKNWNWGIDQNILTEILDEYSGRAEIGNTRLKNLFLTPAIKRQQ